MDSTRRYDARRPVNQFVAPGPLVGTTEGFILETLSTGGLSLLRTARTPDILDKKGLDMRFVCLTIPLPDSSATVTALIEVIHREWKGPMELIRARFVEMSFEDRVTLSDCLARRDHSQSSVAAN